MCSNICIFRVIYFTTHLNLSRNTVDEKYWARESSNVLDPSLQGSRSILKLFFLLLNSCTHIHNTSDLLNVLYFINLLRSPSHSVSRVKKTIISTFFKLSTHSGSHSTRIHSTDVTIMTYRYNIITLIMFTQ